MATILVIDPSRVIRDSLKERLEYEGYKVEVAEDTIAGVTMYSSNLFDLVICGQPDSPIRISIPWIRLSHDTSPESAVLAMRQGAIDFIAKPVDMNRLLEAIRRGLSSPPRQQSAEIQPPPRRGADPEIHPEEASVRQVRPKAVQITPIIGDSEPSKKLKRIIDKVACTEARVLIMGSNGTGKELVARWLHEKSKRSGGPFVEVNCAAIPSELIESELFGHEKGAFTSAVKQHKGKFESAHKGTLFLDEIGDMSLAAQAKVLRVLQERKVTRVGSDKDVDVDVRVIAATNKHVPYEIAHGNFREDLFHRLSVIIINVPTLAERSEDIPQLVENFLEVFCDYYNVPVKSIDMDALEELRRMPWTGNIRELRNVVERLVILCDNPITRDDVVTYANGLG
jgi:DNA-binding NtrC family response regulator